MFAKSLCFFLLSFIDCYTINWAIIKQIMDFYGFGKVISFYISPKLHLGVQNYFHFNCLKHYY